LEEIVAKFSNGWKSAMSGGIVIKGKRK